MADGKQPPASNARNRKDNTFACVYPASISGRGQVSQRKIVISLFEREASSSFREESVSDSSP